MATTPELLEAQLNVALSRRTEKTLKAIEQKEGTPPTAFARVAIAEKLAGRSNEIASLAAELTRLAGPGAPEMALRNALAEVERDAALSRGTIRVEAA